jgi:hypothetical protein
MSGPALAPTQPLVQWVSGGPFPRAKAQTGRDADHSPPSSAEFENELELYYLSAKASSWHVVRTLGGVHHDNRVSPYINSQLILLN